MKTMLFDLDDTLLDFKRSAEQSLQHVFEAYGFTFEKEIRDYYQKTNRSLWKQYEEGNIEKEHVISERFNQTFSAFGKDVPGAEADRLFRQGLEENVYLIDGAEEILKHLSKSTSICAVTNGIGGTQRRRLANAGLTDCFDQLFISGDIGSAKPSEHFFDHVFTTLQQTDRSQTAIIGDSLTADIEGGVRAGITTVWFNPAKETLLHQADLEIHRLQELKTADFTGLKTV
ncbi:YjjG family noncanonical pyrimidine nucleotidase [Alkalicoccus luteus]|uniref:Noncanonical pyrimidine nucleotidase, YjjG family n=1 Tax=Alkalicoccus luteus TaxID=1237094 RepID=A0A969PR39_9BACI|nr:YjjG family noncanonical pyrimidine nucleotidase [Alkalicoccus luteus]NJP37828.1 noncanonical pyrimidine nucleotidase, YjjG family [Alkalicoccus luteus]